MIWPHILLFFVPAYSVPVRMGPLYKLITFTPQALDTSARNSLLLVMQMTFSFTFFRYMPNCHTLNKVYPYFFLHSPHHYLTYCIFYLYWFPICLLLARKFKEAGSFMYFVYCCVSQALNETQAYSRFSLDVSRLDKFIKSPLYVAERHQELFLPWRAIIFWGSGSIQFISFR